MAIRPRVSYAQLETLWEFLNSHRKMAVGYNKSAQARNYSRRMWEILADRLNKEAGATKSWKGWSNYWIDYKVKLKKRASLLRASHSQTGGGPSGVQPLTELELKFLDILGHDYGAGSSNVLDDPLLEEDPDSEQLSQSQSGTAQASFEASHLISEVADDFSDIFRAALPASQPASLLASGTPAAPVGGPIRLQEDSMLHRPPFYSRRETRRQLIELARYRAETERRNSETLEGILDIVRNLQNELRNRF